MSCLDPSSRTHGANELNQLTSDSKFKSTLALLYELLNTIHGAVPQIVAYQDSTTPEITQTLALPISISDKLLEAADQLGGLEK